jgi:hypothetical protein
VFFSDHEDSTRYVKLLYTVFDQSQVFREWLVFLEGEHLPGAPAHALADPSWPANKTSVEEHLMKISEFFYCVLCNLVIRGSTTTNTSRGETVIRSGVELVADVACSVCSLCSDLKSILKRYIKHCMRTLIAH